MLSFPVVCLACRTEQTLGELLKEIQQHLGAVRFDAMANIIAVHCQSESELVGDPGDMKNGGRPRVICPRFPTSP